MASDGLSRSERALANAIAAHAPHYRGKRSSFDWGAFIGPSLVGLSIPISIIGSQGLCPNCSGRFTCHAMMAAITMSGYFDGRRGAWSAAAAAAVEAWQFGAHRSVLYFLWFCVWFSVIALCYPRPGSSASLRRIARKARRQVSDNARSRFSSVVSDEPSSSASNS
jgi:hypothetical protein